MKTRKSIRGAVLAVILGVSGTSGGALAATVAEIEPGILIHTPQPLTVTVSSPGDTKGEVRVEGLLGNLSNPSRVYLQDADFYSFKAQKGDLVTIYINSALMPGSTTTPQLNPKIYLFQSVPGYPVLDWNEDLSSSQTVNEGSFKPTDPRLQDYPLTDDGTYIVGVVGLFGELKAGGVFVDEKWIPGVRSNGAYTLVIKGVSLPPTVVPIKIDIKPGTPDSPAPINPKSQGVIPVALLSSDKFDALTVDQKTLTFGATGREKTYERCQKDGRDFNGDGRLDLLCFFSNRDTQFDEYDSRGYVKGKTTTGVEFQGHGNLKVRPKSRNDE